MPVMENANDRAAWPTSDCDSSHTAPAASLCMFRARYVVSRRIPSMFSKLFRKSLTTRPQVGPDASLAQELERRVNAIQFRPSKGFLKDQQQPKRTAVRVHRSV
jgi:hypothetical protein